MSKIVYSILLLVTLLAMVSTPTAAAGLEKKWEDSCCPIALCIFQKGQKFGHRKRNTNMFDGFIQFTETFKEQLYITGFLDFENGTPEKTADAQGFDVHVANCNVKNIDDGLDLDNIDDIFDRPFVKVLKDKKFQEVNQLVGKCCVVAKDVGSKDQIIAVAPVKQAVKCKPNKIVIGSDPN